MDTLWCLLTSHEHVYVIFIFTMPTCLLLSTVSFLFSRVLCAATESFPHGHNKSTTVLLSVINSAISLRHTSLVRLALDICQMFIVGNY